MDGDDLATAMSIRCAERPQSLKPRRSALLLSPIGSARRGHRGENYYCLPDLDMPLFPAVVIQCHLQAIEFNSGSNGYMFAGVPSGYGPPCAIRTVREHRGRF